MHNLKMQIKVTLVLGALSLLIGLVTLLALTDIYHGEADVTMEWSMVRVCAVVWLAFISLALFTLRRALRELSGA